MANNANVNKVEFGDTVLIDLTNDGVTPALVVEGTTFHDKSGASQIGTMPNGEEIYF